MATYSELLKDPRWQKRRLEVLDRDKFECQLCLDSLRTLHIHHKTYNKNGAPWDVPSSELITYCEECHRLVEFIKTKRKEVDEFLYKGIDLNSGFYIGWRRNPVVAFINTHPVHRGLTVFIMEGSTRKYSEVPLTISVSRLNSIHNAIKRLSDGSY
jgi:hypothetical protein